MIHSMFSVYDQKADAYLPPWIMPRVSMAQRVFGDCVNSSDHQFSHHPEDYTLFHLGDWDDETGEFRSLPSGKRSLGLALEYVKVQTDARQMDLIEATEGSTNGAAKRGSDSLQPVLTSSEGSDTEE